MNSKTKTTPIKKLTLKDLAPKPFRLMLEHPIQGPIDGYVDIVSAHSNAYFLKSIQLTKAATEDMSIEDQMNASAELAATVIIGWDEETFGEEFTTDAATAVLTKVENFWIRDAINAALEDKTNFFKKL